MRTADIQRNTQETRIRLSLCLDGTGKSDIATGVGFLDHMLTLFARHGDFDLTVRCDGDTEVDGHHSVEDIGICLGKAFSQAVGDFDTELAKEFFLALVRSCPGSVHIRQMAGENTHHILEAVFKGMGRTLKAAVALDEKHLGEIPSTKGTL